MYAVVNHLPLKQALDRSLLDKFDAELRPRALAHPGLRAYYLVQVSSDEAIIVVLYDSPEALESGTKQVGSPFFAEHVGPYLAGKPQRKVGEVVALAEP